MSAYPLVCPVRKTNSSHHPARVHLTELKHRHRHHPVQVQEINLSSRSAGNQLLAERVTTRKTGYCRQTSGSAQLNTPIQHRTWQQTAHAEEGSASHPGSSKWQAASSDKRHMLHAEQGNPHSTGYLRFTRNCSNPVTMWKLLTSSSVPAYQRTSVG